MTPRQKQLFEFIAEYMDDTGGIAPTLDEMCKAMGVASKSNIHRMLVALEQRGYIERITACARALKIKAAPPYYRLQRIDCQRHVVQEAAQ